MNDLIVQVAPILITALMGLIAWIATGIKSDLSKMSDSIVSLNQKVAVLITERSYDRDALDKHHIEIEKMKEQIQDLIKGIK